MKPSFVTARVLSFLVFLTGIISCNDRGGKVPFDEERARQHIIPIRQGSQYSQNFVKIRDGELTQQLKDPSFLNQRFNMPIAETFNRDAIAALLNVKGADGVRIYMGNDEKGQVRLVLLPVDKSGKDIITNLVSVNRTGASANASRMAAEEGQAVENGQRPPPPSSGLTVD